jgi:CubicO group peptidase (beta-lactamase class C family)
MAETKGGAVNCIRLYFTVVFCSIPVLACAEGPFAALEGKSGSHSARNPSAHDLDAIVARSGVTRDTPGVGVLVIDHGKVLLEKCYGVAHIRDRRPITPETTFELASCSKQFTGAAILRLQEQGKLSVADPVRKYLPELPVYDRNHPIRISHLARHTSGLREYFDFPDVEGKHADYLVNDDYVGLFARLRARFPPHFPTGSDLRYTNTNFMLLALVVQRVAKEPFGAYLQREFFDPLGMKTATVYEQPDCTPHQPALGYQKKKGKGGFDESWGAPPFRHERLLLAGDGSIWASLADMARWDAGWREGKVLKPATIESYLAPSTYGDGKSTDYAFGWGVSVDDGRLLKMEHNGEWGGFTTHVRRDVARGRTVIVLANVDCVDIDAILRLCDALPAHVQE